MQELFGFDKPFVLDDVRVLYKRKKDIRELNQSKKSLDPFKPTHIQVLQQVDLGLVDQNQKHTHFSFDLQTPKRLVMRLTMISPSSALGMLAKWICLTATVSPLVKFRAPKQKTQPCQSSLNHRPAKDGKIDVR